MEDALDTALAWGDIPAYWDAFLRMQNSLTPDRRAYFRRVGVRARPPSAKALKYVHANEVLRTALAELTRDPVYAVVRPHFLSVREEVCTLARDALLDIEKNTTRAREMLRAAAAMLGRPVPVQWDDRRLPLPWAALANDLAIACSDGAIQYLFDASCDVVACVDAGNRRAREHAAFARGIAGWVCAARSALAESLPAETAAALAGRDTVFEVHLPKDAITSRNVLQWLRVPGLAVGGVLLATAGLRDLELPTPITRDYAARNYESLNPSDIANIAALIRFVPELQEFYVEYALRMQGDPKYAPILLAAACMRSGRR